MTHLKVMYDDISLHTYIHYTSMLQQFSYHSKCVN